MAPIILTAYETLGFDEKDIEYFKRTDPGKAKYIEMVLKNNIFSALSYNGQQFALRLKKEALEARKTEQWAS